MEWATELIFVTIQDLLPRSRLRAHPRTMPDRNALPHSLEIPDDELKRLREQVAEQAAIIEGQTATIEQMPERIQELEARLAKDSHNSSRPPSSDSPCTKPLPRSRRQPSGRKPGGQPGRRGVLRSVVDDSDQCVIIPLTGTCTCGRCGTEIAATVLAERCHVVEATPRGRGGDPA